MNLPFANIPADSSRELSDDAERWTKNWRIKTN